MLAILVTQSYSETTKYLVDSRYGVRNILTDKEKIAQIYYDGLQEVKNSIGKLDDTLRTKIFCELSETDDLLNQKIDELRKNMPRAKE